VDIDTRGTLWKKREVKGESVMWGATLTEMSVVLMSKATYFVSVPH
jgi:hypothetical protein